MRKLIVWNWQLPTRFTYIKKSILERVGAKGGFLCAYYKNSLKEISNFWSWVREMWLKRKKNNQGQARCLSFSLLNVSCMSFWYTLALRKACFFHIWAPIWRRSKIRNVPSHITNTIFLSLIFIFYLIFVKIERYEIFGWNRFSSIPYLQGKLT